MGLFFDDTYHTVAGEIVTTLRKVPISSGGLARILLPGFFSLTKWNMLYIKEWGRRYYKTSSRYVMIYRTNTLSDGVYQIQSVKHTPAAITDDGEILAAYDEWIAHYFYIEAGTAIALDNANQAYDRLAACRVSLERDITALRQRLGYSMREIDHMVETKKWTVEVAARFREQRYLLEAAYYAETDPTANLPQGQLVT